MSVSETILKEADILWKALATGVLLVFVYDLIRIIRRIIPHNNFLISMEDFLFWLGSAVTIFAMLFRENDGYLRGFSVGSVVLGMVLYSCLISKFIVKWLEFFLEKIIFVLSRPLVWTGKILSRPFGICKRQTSKVSRFLKKQLKKIWKTVKIGLCKL